MSVGPYGSGSFGTVPFSNTPLFNSRTLIDSVLRDTGHSNPSTETAKRLAVLGFLNNRYARITSARHWDWLNQDLDYTFEGAINDSMTVTATQGSEVITGLGTNWDSSLVGRKIIISNYVNFITKVNSTTELEVEGEWSGPTGSTYTYRITKSIYQLPADCEHVKSINLDRIGEMVPVGVQEFDRKKQYRPDYIGIPMWYTEIARRAEDGVRLIEVYPHPDIKYNVHLNYNVQIMALQDSENSFPLIPDRYRVILYYGALSEMFRYLRDTTNSQLAEADYQRTLITMQNDTQLTDSKYIIQPGRDYKSRRRRRRFRVSMDRTDFSRDG